MLAVTSPAGAASASRTCSSAMMNWSASAGRSAGSLLSAQSTTCSSAEGISGLIWLGGTGASETCFSAIETGDSPSNGTRPVSIS